MQGAKNVLRKWRLLAAVGHTHDQKARIRHTPERLRVLAAVSPDFTTEDVLPFHWHLVLRSAKKARAGKNVVILQFQMALRSGLKIMCSADDWSNVLHSVLLAPYLFVTKY